MRKGDDDLTTFIVPKVEKTRSLILRIAKGLFRPVAGKFYLYYYCYYYAYSKTFLRRMNSELLSVLTYRRNVI